MNERVQIAHDLFTKYYPEHCAVVVDDTLEIYPQDQTCIAQALIRKISEIATFLVLDFCIRVDAFGRTKIEMR